MTTSTPEADKAFRCKFDEGFLTAVVLGDDVVTWDDLTIREQQTVRANVRAILKDDQAQLGDGANMDLVPSLATVVHARAGQTIELDDALNYRVDEVSDDELKKLLAKKAGGRGKRPRKGSNDPDTK